MELSEKIYLLRKKSGLSQEQLADKLGVSRQAISKWESGHSLPENGKLLSISEYFNVSLDVLMKDCDMYEESKVIHSNESESEQNTYTWIAGTICCSFGVLCLIFWSISVIFSPDVSKQISQSSMITLNGNAIFLLICICAITTGSILILKSILKK